ncbi:TPA: HEAT repeat domain-containing protein [Candidatus Poribacteria bacterium]|nr:HEAT repeat domain-containing protein [Candidatus Poribacteria bacterium]
MRMSVFGDKLLLRWIESMTSLLIEVLKDEDEYIRYVAVRELWKIGTPEAVRALEEYERNR